MEHKNQGGIQVDSEHNIKPLPSRKSAVWLFIILLVLVIAVGSYFIGIKYSATVAKTPLKIDSVPRIVTLPEQEVIGKVTNLISGEAIGGAKITLGKIDSISDNQGKFILKSSESIIDNITITKDGFITKKYTLQKTNDVRLTPVGKIFYVSNRDGKKAIYSANFDGSEEETLVSRIGDGEDYNIAQSPHDRLIVFLSTRNSRKNKYNSYEPELFIVKADGSELKKISDWYRVGSVKWSPDGKYLSWTGNEKDDSSGTKMAILDVVANKQVDTGLKGDNVSSATWADNESAVAYSIYSSTDSNRVGLWVADSDGEPAEKISNNTGHSKYNDEGNIEFSGYSESTTKYYTWNKTTKETKETSPLETKSRVGTKSPNGNIVAYSDNRDGKTNLFVSNIDKTNERQLTKIDAVSGNIMWTQDGKYIIFSVIRTGESARYIVESSGIGGPRKITDELNYASYGY